MLTLAPFIVVCLCGVVSADPVRFSRVDLPFPPGIDRLIPEGISNNGVVAGWSSGPFNAGGAFRWTAGEGTSLIANPQGVTAFNVSAISDAGAVAGRTIVGGAGSTVQGVFRKTDDAPMNVAPGLTSLLGGFVTGVNDNGVSTGWWLRRLPNQDITGSAWVFSAPNSLTLLSNLMPEPDSLSRAIGINNAGQVAGWLTITDRQHAFRWSSAEGMQIALTPPGFSVAINAINQAGQIVGTMTDDAADRAVRITDDNGQLVIEDLSSVLACWAMATRGEAINDLGHVAGSYTRFDGARRGYLLADDGFPLDLGDVVGQVTAIMGINNRDEIVFVTFDDEKVTRPYYWSRRTGAVLLSTAVEPPIENESFGLAPQDISDAGQVVIEQPTAGSNTGRAIVLTPLCASDANADGLIDAADLSVLLSGFGKPVFAGTGGDLNADTRVDAADLSVLLASFGNQCP